MAKLNNIWSNRHITKNKTNIKYYQIKYVEKWIQQLLSALTHQHVGLSVNYMTKELIKSEIDSKFYQYTIKVLWFCQG